MPRNILRWRYDVILNGQPISAALAVVWERASGARRWHVVVSEDNRILEEEAARELFPNISGTYYVPAFEYKPADQPDHTPTTERIPDGRPEA